MKKMNLQPLPDRVSTRVSDRVSSWGVLLSLALGGASFVAACGGDGPDPDALTYYQDVKPIIDAKCAGCHRDGGVAPFSLTSYEDAVAYAGISRIAVELGNMPPWHAAEECNDYYASRALEPADKAMFLEWVDAGTLEGSPEDEGPPLEVESTSLARVDSTLTMPESYTPAPAPGKYDDYRCFIVPWPETITKYVTGLRVRAGNQAVAHHAIAFLAQPEDAAVYQDLDAGDAGPGWACFGGTGGPAREWLGAWVPGQTGADLPAGLGLEVRPGSLIVLQMHYNTLYAANGGGGVAPDQTSLDFRIDDQVDKVAHVQPWADPNWVLGGDMPIPANEPDVVHSFAFDPTIVPFGGADSVEIYHAGLHMHLLGTSGRLSIERAGGTSDCLLQIDQWDFDWQGDYQLRTPQILNSGDQLRVECHWDNTLENQPTVDGQPLPPADVNWGEDSTDEMCLGIFLVAVP
jgi:hypothetical protein